MRIFITGFANSGKTTVFNALTGLNNETSLFASVMEEPNIGSVKVPDSRIDTLTEIFKPKKSTKASIEYIDFMGLTKGDMNHNRKVFDLIKDVDAIVDVVRGFEDASIAHPFETVEPARDIEFLETELIFSDLDLTEKRLVKIEEMEGKGKKTDPSEKSILLKCKDALEGEKPLREMNFNDEEIKSSRHLQFVSNKPKEVLLNISEEDLSNNKLDSPRAGFQSDSFISICGKIEMELAQMPPDEALEFLNDMGITEPALNRFIKVCYGHLGLISFFTVGEDEVKAWTIKDGTIALDAAGKIHSDIKKGFIRAEVVSYDDFISTGSMAEARKKGVIHLEKKTYTVKDGDIINFRFNV